MTLGSYMPKVETQMSNIPLLFRAENKLSNLTAKILSMFDYFMTKIATTSRP